MHSQRRLITIIDDEESVRSSLAVLLMAENYAVRTYSSADAALANIEQIAESCVLTDIRMPQASGLDLLRRLRGMGLTTPVILMTAHADVPTAVTAMKLGATDFIEKPFDPADLIAMLGSLSRPAACTMEAAQVQRRLAELTPRERDVFELVVEGATNKEAAARLGLSPRTVEIHRANLMQKLGVKRLSGLIHLAMRAGGASPAADVDRDDVGVGARLPAPHVAYGHLER